MASINSDLDPKPSSQTSKPVSDSEEDDYLTMTFDEPTKAKPKKETLTEIRKRKLLHAETAGRQKSKAELAAEEARRREEALAKKLDSENKGLKMMQKLGYKPGMALGVAREGNSARLEPIGLAMKEDRSGIGRESEAKRKFREELEKQGVEEKKRKIDEGEFFDRVRAEREAARQESQTVAAQKVCERLEEEDIGEKERKRRKLSSVNILWRGLVKKRELEERDRRMRHDLYTSLSNRPDYDDPEEDKDDKIALDRSKKTEVFEVDDEELDQEDPELEAFEAEEPAEKLVQVVKCLRDRWRYCFWCKYRYEDESMEGCPGEKEEDHD